MVAAPAPTRVGVPHFLINRASVVAGLAAILALVNDAGAPSDEPPIDGGGIGRPRIDVVLPALDEAAALPGVLRARPERYRAIVVDNGSTDGTPSVAREHGAVVVSEPRRGFGSACWAGLGAAESDIVCFMDADGSFDAAELPLVTAPVEAGRYELVLGARRAEPGSWPLHARIANRVLALELRRRTGLALRDLGPMRAANREQLVALGVADRRSGWPLEMVLRAHRAGWRISEQPITYHPRIGRSKVTGTVRGTARAVTDMGRILRTIPAGPPPGSPAPGGTAPGTAPGGTARAGTTAAGRP
jgi:hypothetical protein